MNWRTAGRVVKVARKTRLVQNKKGGEKLNWGGKRPEAAGGFKEEQGASSSLRRDGDLLSDRMRMKSRSCGFQAANWVSVFVSREPKFSTNFERREFAIFMVTTTTDTLHQAPRFGLWVRGGKSEGLRFLCARPRFIWVKVAG
jgi:hypothetical protein